MFQEYDGGYWLNIQPSINKGLDDNRKLLEATEFIGRWNDIVVHARWTTQRWLVQSLGQWGGENLLLWENHVVQRSLFQVRNL